MTRGGGGHGQGDIVQAEDAREDRRNARGFLHIDDVASARSIAGRLRSRGQGGRRTRAKAVGGLRADASQLRVAGDHGDADARYDILPSGRRAVGGRRRDRVGGRSDVHGRRQGRRIGRCLHGLPHDPGMIHVDHQCRHADGDRKQDGKQRCGSPGPRGPEPRQKILDRGPVHSTRSDACAVNVQFEPPKLIPAIERSQG